MSYFAKIQPTQDADTFTVVDVIAIQIEELNSGLWGDPLQWIQTSYNTRGGVHYGQNGQPDGGIALRANYAFIGGIYNKPNDVFYSPQPYPSWTISAPTWLWEAPVPLPTPNNPPIYCWDEETLSWKLSNKQ